LDQIRQTVHRKLIHDVMSFFGFDTSLPAATNEQHQEEDLAVFTWGTENYSNLGQALQEVRDEFNDETFGFSEAVGRAFSVGIDSPEQELTTTGQDFDFGNTVDIHTSLHNILALRCFTSTTMSSEQGRSTLH